MWRSTVFGEHRGGQRCPWWSDLRRAASTSASRGVTPAADMTRAGPGPAAGAAAPVHRPAGAAIGTPRPPPVGRRNRRRPALPPANASGLPTRRDGRLGHQSASMVAVPVARSQLGVGVGEGLLGLHRGDPVDPARRRGRGPPNPGSANTRSDPRPPPRPPRLAHHRSRGRGAAPTGPAWGAVTGVSRSSSMPASSSTSARRRSSRTSHSSARAMIAAPPRTSRCPAEMLTPLSMAASISAR